MGERGIEEKILKLLVRDDYGLTIEEVANALEINRMTASKYLAILEATGKITVREVGKAKLHYPKTKNGYRWPKPKNRKSSCGLNAIGLIFPLMLFFAAAIFLTATTSANSGGGTSANLFEMSVTKDYPEKLIILQIKGPPLMNFSLILLNPENKSITPKDNIFFQTDEKGEYELRIIGFVPGSYAAIIKSSDTEYAQNFEVENLEIFECNRTFLEYKAENLAAYNESNASFIPGAYVWDICRDFVETNITREELISEMAEDRNFLENGNATNETGEKPLAGGQPDATEAAEEAAGSRTFLENETLAETYEKGDDLFREITGIKGKKAIRGAGWQRECPEDGGCITTYYPGRKFYKKSGEWNEINTSFELDNGDNRWKAEKNSFKVRANGNRITITGEEDSEIEFSVPADNLPVAHGNVLAYDLSRSFNVGNENYFVNATLDLTLHPDRIEKLITVYNLSLPYDFEYNETLKRDLAKGRFTIGELSVWDSAGNAYPASWAYEADKIKFTIKRSWLDDAVYPVYIDPTVYYNYSDSTNNKAYKKGDTNYQAYPTAPTWANGWVSATEATADEYINLSTDNAAYARSVSGGSNRDALWRFEFKINENMVLLNWVYVRFNGYENAGEAGYCYIANFSGSGSWVLFNTTIPTADGDISQNYTSGFSDIINSTNGKLALYCYGDDFDASASDTVFADFVEVRVDYTPDTTPPVVNIDASLNNTVTADTTPDVSFNFTDSKSSTANCTLYFNNTAYNTTNNVNNNTQTTLTANASLSAGRYDVYVNCTDMFGNTGMSGVLNMTINLPPSVVNAASPTPMLNGTAVNISATVTDSDEVSKVIAMMYYPNGTFIGNYSMSSSGNVYWNASYVANFYPHGTYNVTIWANDTAGYVNSTEKTWFAPYLNLSQSAAITIDGAFADWSGVNTVTDPMNDSIMQQSQPGSWPMLMNNLNHTSYTTSRGPNNFSVVSKSFATGFWVYSTPTFTNTTVYFGSFDYSLYAVNISNISQMLGNFSTGGFIPGAPAIYNGVVYFGSYDNRVYAVNASNISQQFGNFSVGLSIDCGPAVANGIVYIGSLDKSLYALNASNISQQFGNFSTGGEIRGCPAVVNGVVYFTSRDSRVYAVNASNVSQQLGNYTTGGEIYSSPSYYNGIVYVGSLDFRVYALNASNISRQLANFTTQNFVESSAAIFNGTVYIGSNDAHLYALNASNISQQLGNFSSNGLVKTAPAIANGIVYFGTLGNTFYAVNASNVSQQLANYTAGGQISSSPSVANGVVYFGCDDNFVYAIGTYQVNTTSTYASAFDIANASLANNATHLLAKLSVNGNISAGSSADYYRLFLSNGTVGDATTNEGNSLPFSYSHSVQINGSACTVYNYNGQSIGTCSFANNSNTVELSVNLSVLNLSIGSNVNATFETASSSGRYDIAPDLNSFLSYDVASAPLICGQTLTSSITLTENLTSTGTCFTVGANNIVIDGNGYTISGDGTNIGIFTDQYQNLTVKNFAGINNFIAGVYLNVLGQQYVITNNTIIGANVPSGFGIGVVSSDDIVIANNSIITVADDHYGVYVNSVDRGTVENNNIFTQGARSSAVYIGATRDVLVARNNLTTLAADTIYLQGVSTYGNNITNNTINNSNTTTYHITFDNTDVNSIVDMLVGRYNITGSQPTILSTGNAKIVFLESTSQTGENLSSDIQLRYNYTYINASQTGLNKSANITLYGLFMNYLNPVILRDGAPCPADICTNLTSLNAGNVTFNVSGWTSYSIGEAPCSVDFNMTYQLQAGIMFEEQDPSQTNVSASGNGDYNVTDLSTSGCGTVNVSIMSTGDLVNGSSVIGIGNVTVNSTSPDSQTIQLSTSYQLIRPNVPAGTNNITTFFFWLTVPQGQESRAYNTTIYIKEERE